VRSLLRVCIPRRRDSIITFGELDKLEAMTTVRRTKMFVRRRTSAVVFVRRSTTSLDPLRLLMQCYASALGGRSSFIRRVFSSVTKESMLFRNSSRSAGVIGLAAVSSHPKRTLSFRPLMSRTSFSRSVDMGVTSSREHEIASPGVAPAIAWLSGLGKWSGAGAAGHHPEVTGAPI
jgi:hypothetical protein